MKSWHERCLQPCLFLCSIRQPFLRPDRALLPSPPRADAVKVGRRANHATMSDFARPHLGRWRARRQACMGRAEDDQTIGHREVGARNALSAKPTMCTRMHRSQFPFRTSLQCAGMGTGTPIKRRDCCAIKLRERAYQYKSHRDLAAHHAPTAITPQARSACHFAGHKTLSPSRQPGAVRSAGRRRVPFVCRTSGRGRTARRAG